MVNIRVARGEDASRLAEIEVFNYRLSFYPIFGCDKFYFDELSVSSIAEKYNENKKLIAHTYVYDDGVVKGFIRIAGREVEKLFVEPVLHGKFIGARLLEYVIEKHGITFLWVLEKNTDAMRFYERHGFHKTNDMKLEEGTDEYLLKMVRPTH